MNSNQIEQQLKENELLIVRGFKPKKENWITHLTGKIRQLFTGKKYSESYQERLNTALSRACRDGDADQIAHLLDNGANLHVESCSFYFEKFACSSVGNEILDTLISRGLDIHYDDDCILRFAATFGNIQTVKMMLERGSNMHAKNDYTIKTAAGYHHPEIVNLLLIDYNMSIKEETIIWLKENDCPEALEILDKRDLNNSLESKLKPKEETVVKQRKIKI